MGAEVGRRGGEEEEEEEGGGGRGGRKESKCVRVWVCACVYARACALCTHARFIIGRAPGRVGTDDFRRKKSKHSVSARARARRTRRCRVIIKVVQQYNGVVLVRRQHKARRNRERGLWPGVRAGWQKRARSSRERARARASHTHSLKNDVCWFLIGVIGRARRTRGAETNAGRQKDSALFVGWLRVLAGRRRHRCCVASRQEVRGQATECAVLQTAKRQEVGRGRGGTKRGS